MSIDAQWAAGDADPIAAGTDPAAADPGVIAAATDPAAEPVPDDDRLRRIEAVTDTSLAHLDVNALLDELLHRVQELLDADTAAVLLHDPSSQELVAAAARGIEGRYDERIRIPMGKGFAGRIAAEKKPIVLTTVDESTVINPILRQTGVRALLGVPLLAGGTVIGILHVGSLTPRTFSDDDTQLLQLVADRIALATQTRLSDTDRAAAVALQRSLLPARLPTIPGIELAARYVTGSGGVGGDWYDVFDLPTGGWGIVIGDVVGRGLRAAVVMGRLRSALRAYAIESDDPANVLTKLDRKVQHFEPDMMTTVLYLTIDPSLDVLRISLAGHVPPVLALPGERAELLEVPVDLPLGVSLKQVRRTTEVAFPHGALMCLYTDGLVERRGHPLDGAMELLRKSVVTRAPVESLCTAVMAQFADDDPSDDVALVAVRRTCPGDLST